VTAAVAATRWMVRSHIAVANPKPLIAALDGLTIKPKFLYGSLPKVRSPEPHAIG
jgi:hypothetical protein